MMPKFPVLMLFLMSILLAGVVTPTINGFQILGSVPINTYIDFAFAQTEDTEETDDTTEDETDDTTEDETDDTTEDETEDVDDEDDIRSLGQEVSTFVHDTKDQFRAQKEETKAIIKQCRDTLENASTIRSLNSLTEQEELKDKINDLRMQMREEFRAQIKNLREQMKAERETIREEIKKMIVEGATKEKINEELKSIREQMKEEHEKMKEQMKEEREKMKEEREKIKEQMKEEREKMKEESEKTRESEEKS